MYWLVASLWLVGSPDYVSPLPQIQFRLAVEQVSVKI